MLFSMLVTRRIVTGSGSRSGDGGQEAPTVPETIGQMRPDEMDAKIHEILQDEVATMFRAQLSEMCGSIKTAMVEYFDERYAALTEAGCHSSHIGCNDDRGGSQSGYPISELR